MTKILPRPSVSGLQAAFASCSLRTTTATTSTSTSSIWSSTRRRAISPSSSPTSLSIQRSLSTIAHKKSTYKHLAVPPESPDFVQIPKTLQPNAERRPKLKGHLPIPRPIFSSREGDRRVTAKFMKQTAPISKAERARRKPKSINDARHRLMAASRREALRAGLQGLWERKQHREERALKRNTAKRTAHRAAALAPERSDELLTRATVRAATALTTEVIPDPERFTKAEAAAERHRAKMALKAEQRRDALARLYVAAGNFIVDEKELEARVSAVFKDNVFHTHVFASSSNIWETQGHPITVAELKAEMTAGGQAFTFGTKSDLGKSTVRQKLVAEELTGGKL